MVLNAYAIVFVALLVLAGILANRLGRKRVLLPGLGESIPGVGGDRSMRSETGGSS